MSMNVRLARPEDADAACAVLRRSIIECCGQDHGGDETILAAWLKNKTPENLKNWFCSSDAYAVVAEREGQVIGVALLVGNNHVALCYLLPEARFGGVGKALLGALETQARRGGAQEMTLSATQTAHQFYLRNGFVDTGEVESGFGMVSPKMRKALPIGAPG